MFFHQTANSIGNQIYNAFLYRDVFWNLHLHRSFEICLVRLGTVNATVGAKEYALHAGDCILIPPFFPHSYRGEKGSICFIAVFSGSFVPKFDSLIQTRQYASYCFSLDEETASFVAKNMGFSHLEVPDGFERIAADCPDVFLLKSCLYALIARLNQTVSFKEKKQETELLSCILTYIQDHFTEDISLASLCKELGYNYEYISKFFHQALGIHFKTLINQYRCERANELMEAGNKSLSEVAFESGFQSIRTFNRVFKYMTGHSPSQNMPSGTR